MNRRNFVRTVASALATLPFMGWVAKAAGLPINTYAFRSRVMSTCCVVREYADGTIDAAYGHSSLIAALDVDGSGLEPMRAKQDGRWIVFDGLYGSQVRCRLCEKGTLEIDFVLFYEPRDDGNILTVSDTFGKESLPFEEEIHSRYLAFEDA